MNTVESIKELRQELQQHRMSGKRIAFVPTMGNLHEGHLQLVRKAHQHGDIVVTSIFVNPLQFGANEDFASYPKTLEADKAQLLTEGCHLLFAPTVEEMYPNGQPIATQVAVKSLGKDHCGSSRPGHFEGVATVVTKLFGIVQPDAALFGEKDYQQLAVIRQLTFDLSLPIEVIGVPTERDKNGLALSSRNSYLSSEELAIAANLYKTLNAAKQKLLSHHTTREAIEDSAKQQLEALGFIPDYFTVCRQNDLQPAEVDDKEIVILAAATLGKARLIDNLAFCR